MSFTRKIRGGAPHAARSRRTRTRRKQLANGPRHTRNYELVQKLMNRRAPKKPTVENVVMREFKAKHSHTTKKHGMKKLLKRAARDTADPFNNLRHIRKFLGKAIDTYKEVEADEVNDEEQATIKFDILSGMFLMLRADIEEFADDSDNDVTEFGNYSGLKGPDPNNGQEHFRDEGLLEYMEMFHDYLTDVLEHFKRPSEENFHYVDKLQKIIQSVLRQYVEENHDKQTTPTNITDDLDGLLDKMKL
jgi:Mg2+ and Co2+ transporter CorA